MCFFPLWILFDPPLSFHCFHYQPTDLQTNPPVVLDDHPTTVVTGQQQRVMKFTTNKKSKRNDVFTVFTHKILVEFLHYITKKKVSHSSFYLIHMDIVPSNQKKNDWAINSTHPSYPAPPLVMSPNLGVRPSGFFNSTIHAVRGVGKTDARNLGA